MLLKNYHKMFSSPKSHLLFSETAVDRIKNNFQKRLKILKYVYFWGFYKAIDIESIRMNLDHTLHLNIIKRTSKLFLREKNCKNIRFLNYIKVSYSKLILNFYEFLSYMTFYAAYP